MINNISSSIYTGAKVPESSIERPEGFQGSSRDVFVRDQARDYDAEKAFRDAGKLFQTRQAAQSAEAEMEEVSMFPNRNGYDSSFLGKELALPTLGESIRDKASHLTNQPNETELTYTNFSIVMNKERKQCFYTACNIDGNQSQNIKRSGSWTIDGRIPREHQLGNEAYANNTIDRGHMVRRLDPCWGKQAQQANYDTFCYTNATMQCEGLNQKEWLQLENHVLDSAHGQKMTVITGPVFSDDDPKFDNHGQINPPTQIPEKFWKVVVWNDQKSGELKGAAFVLSQEDILNQSGDLFKSFDPGRFGVYQVPVEQLENMTQLQFGEFSDITTNAVRLTADNNYAPANLA